MPNPTNPTSGTSGAAHTATPWSYRTPPDDERPAIKFWIDAENGMPVADVKENGHEQANAAFIVAACNSHDALVYALKRALAVISQHHPEDSNCCAADITTIRAALAQAQGEVTK